MGSSGNRVSALDGGAPLCLRRFLQPPPVGIGDVIDHGNVMKLEHIADGGWESNELVAGCVGSRMRIIGSAG